jgi:hypothetical protein
LQTGCERLENEYGLEKVFANRSRENEFLSADLMLDLKSWDDGGRKRGENQPRTNKRNDESIIYGGK